MVAASLKARLRPGHIVAAATFLAAGVLRLPLVWVMAVAAPVGVALAWWEQR